MWQRRLLGCRPMLHCLHYHLPLYASRQTWFSAFRFGTTTTTTTHHHHHTFTHVRYGIHTRRPPATRLHAPLSGVTAAFLVCVTVCGADGAALLFVARTADRRYTTTYHRHYHHHHHYHHPTTTYHTPPPHHHHHHHLPTYHTHYHLPTTTTTYHLPTFEAVALAG